MSWREKKKFIKRELRSKEKTIQEGIEAVHPLKYVALHTEGLNEDVIEQLEKDVNHRAFRFEDMVESITNDISEIEDKVRENMFAIAREEEEAKAQRKYEEVERLEEMRKGVSGSKEEERGSSTAKTVAKPPKLEIG